MVKMEAGGIKTLMVAVRIMVLTVAGAIKMPMAADHITAQMEVGVIKTLMEVVLFMNQIIAALIMM